MNSQILNRNEAGDFVLPADGWFHLAPRGEYPHLESGLWQVLDERAIRSMVERFAQDSRQLNFPGLLVDFDHFSYDPEQPSTAAGWITGLESRPDGLWGRIRWSDAGETALKNGRFRLISPAWRPEDCEEIQNYQPSSPAARLVKAIRPLRLDTAGLTNNPNLRGMVPLSNREGPKPPGECPAVKGQQRKESMKQINAVLGLAPEAAEEAALAEITKLVNRATSAETKITVLEQQNQELLAAQVEADLDRFAERFAPDARDKWKQALLMNRLGTLELLQSLPEPVKSPGANLRPGSGDAPPPMHNRARAKTPDSPALSLEDSRLKAVREYRLRTGCGFQAAWEAVQTDQPELFRAEA